MTELRESSIIKQIRSQNKKECKLDLPNFEITRIDWIFWNTDHIIEVNLAYNQINSMRNIDQFKNLRYLDISNNLIEGLADLRILGNLKKLEYLDMTNNEITRHPIYFDFTIVFNKKLKTLDRQVVKREDRKRVDEECSFLTDILDAFLQNFAKIISLRILNKKRELHRELLPFFGRVFDEEAWIKNNRFEIMQDCVTKDFSEKTLVDFQSLIIEDLECLMEPQDDSQPFLDIWRNAFEDYSSRQLKKYNKMLQDIQPGLSGNQNISLNHSFKQLIKNGQSDGEDDEAVSQPRRNIPQPSVSYKDASDCTSTAFKDNSTIGKKQNFSKRSLKTREKTSITQTRRPASSKKSFSRMNGRSSYSKKCTSFSPHVKPKMKLKPNKFSKREKEVNKRLYEIENLLKEKIEFISNTLQETGIVSEEADRLKEIRLELLGQYREKEIIIQKNEELRQYITKLENEINSQDDYDDKIQKLRQKKLKIMNRVRQLKVKVEENSRVTELNELKEMNKSASKLSRSARNIFNTDERGSTFSPGDTKTNFFLSMKNKKTLSIVFSEWKFLAKNSVRIREIEKMTRIDHEEKLQKRLFVKQEMENAYRLRTEEIRYMIENDIKTKRVKVRRSRSEEARKRRYNRRVRYFVSSIRDFKLNYLESAFFRIKNPNFNLVKKRLNRGTKLRVFMALLSQSQAKRQARHSAGLLYEEKQLRIKSRAFTALKLESGKKEDLNRFEKKMAKKVLRKFVKNWRMNLRKKLKEKSKLEYFKRRIHFLKKEEFFDNLREYAQKSRIKKMSLKKIFKFRNKKKLKGRFRQFFHGVRFRKFSEKVKNFQMRKYKVLSIEALANNKNVNLTSKNITWILTKKFQKSKRELSLESFQAINSYSFARLNKDLRLKSFTDRINLKKKQKLFKLIFNNYLQNIRKTYLQEEQEYAKITEASEIKIKENEEMDDQLNRYQQRAEELKEEIESTERDNKTLEILIEDQVREYNSTLGRLNHLVNELQEVEIGNAKTTLNLKSQLSILNTKKNELINTKAMKIQQKQRLQGVISDIKLRKAEKESSLAIAEKKFKSSEDDERNEISQLNKDFYRLSSLKKLENNKLSSLQAQLNNLNSQLIEAREQKTLLISGKKKQKNFWNEIEEASLDNKKAKEQVERLKTETYKLEKGYMKISTDFLKKKIQTVTVPSNPKRQETDISESKKTVRFLDDENNHSMALTGEVNGDLLDLKNEILEIKSFRKNIHNDLKSRLAALAEDMNSNT